ncbi:MAG: potassium channel family protein [Candidatus Celaenobacter polaris]|nr:potassium channel family protein [Candidatus Celaenobacter polaris]
MNFENEVSFVCIDFENCKLDFYDSVIYPKAQFSMCQFSKYCNFQFKKCNYLDLRGSTNRGVINLTNNLKNNQQNIQTIDLIKFINLGIIQIDWSRNNVQQLIENQGVEITHREKAEQFRILKENFRKIGQYDDEDKAYVEYRKHEMKALLKERTKGKFLNIFWAYPFYGIAWFVKDWLGLFGTNPWRVLANMSIFYFFFSAIYFFLLKLSNCGIYPANEKVDILTNFCKALYHSAITFLTIGYGDYYPSGIIRIFSGIEGFIDLFLMAYFVVAFSRKVLR